MKKKIKDCTDEEILENSEDPKVLAMIGFYATYSNKEEPTFKDMYNAVCKMKELMEEEIEVEQ